MDLFEYAPPLEKALDAATMRQQVISNNMAHVNDPNYRGQAVAFERQHARRRAALQVVSQRR